MKTVTIILCFFIAVGVTCPAIALAATGIHSNGERYYLEINLPLQGIPLNEYLDLEVTIYRGGAIRRRAKNIQLAFDAVMTSHHHGMNVLPLVKRIGKGKFKISGILLHMPGVWDVYFHVFEDGVIERAEFKLNLE